jgi:hypothetical protein
MFLYGCSPHKAAQRTDGLPKSFTFTDGSVMQVQKQDGVLLAGIHLVEKSPEGLRTCDAEKGKMIEDEDRQVVHVTLYDALVELASKQRMTVQELKIDFVLAGSLTEERTLQSNGGSKDRKSNAPH